MDVINEVAVDFKEQRQLKDNKTFAANEIIENSFINLAVNYLKMAEIDRKTSIFVTFILTGCVNLLSVRRFSTSSNMT